MKTLMVLVVVLGVVGCGPASAPIGEACDGGAPPMCDRMDRVAYCEAGVWKAFQCPSGCKDATLCDWNGVSNSQECPRAISLTGHCDGTKATNCIEDRDAGRTTWRVSDCAETSKACLPFEQRTICN